MTPRRTGIPLFRSAEQLRDITTANARFREHIGAGQMDLTVRPDHPTARGYDPDHPAAAGAVGGAGVNIAHLGDMRALFDGIPLDRAVTRLPGDASAPWLLALLIATAEERGVPAAALRGTVHYDMAANVARDGFICPPGPSLRLATDLTAYVRANLPRMRSLTVGAHAFHESSAAPEDEIAFALATACMLLDRLRNELPDDAFARVLRTTGFTLGTGVRALAESSKIRAFAELWFELCRDRYAVGTGRDRRFRYTLRVSGSRLASTRPETYACNLFLAALPAHFSGSLRPDIVFLPTPTDSGTLLPEELARLLYDDSDLADLSDLADCDPAVARRVAALKAAARSKVARLADMADPAEAVGQMRQALVAADAARTAGLDSGAPRFGKDTATAVPSDPTLGASRPEAAADLPDDRSTALRDWRRHRDGNRVQKHLVALREAAKRRVNIMGPSIACARAGATTGEWAEVMRQVFGSYRLPPDLPASALPDSESLAALRRRVKDIAERLGRPPTIATATPGLDGRVAGAERIGLRARACGFVVVPLGTQAAAERIVAGAQSSRAHLIVLGKSADAPAHNIAHLMHSLRVSRLSHIPAVLHGAADDPEMQHLTAAGLARVYSSGECRINAILNDLIDLIDSAEAAAQ